MNRLIMNRFNMPLLPGTVLADGKYRIENVCDSDRISIAYSALNIAKKSHILIREFIPEEVSRSETSDRVQYMKRALFPGEWEISDSQKDITNWKAAKAYYAKWAVNILKRKRIQGFLWVSDVFYQNNTVYVVTEDVNGIGLRCYIDRHRPPLDTAACFRLLTPLMDALIACGNDFSAYHYVIYPSNIIVSDTRRAYFFNLGILDWPPPSLPSSYVSVPMVSEHTNFLPQNLPEPYEVSAICALLYYCVTRGEMKGSTGTTESPELWSYHYKIPLPVYHVLQRGLNCNAKERILNMKALRKELGAAIQASE